MNITMNTATFEGYLGMYRAVAQFIPGSEEFAPFLNLDLDTLAAMANAEKPGAVKIEGDKITVEIDGDEDLLVHVLGFITKMINRHGPAVAWIVSDIVREAKMVLQSAPPSADDSEAREYAAQQRTAAAENFEPPAQDLG